jgi:16S rRNA (uracil1498-N3)-methyltransferase
MGKPPAERSMVRYDFAARRLYIEVPLDGGTRVELNPAQGHYLRNVLRLSDGAEILVFNGRDGEWRARLSGGSRNFALVALTQTRRQEQGADLHYLFAPLKHARLDYMVQKAVEMGAGLLQPVLTRRTQTERVNIERMRANAIEAAEQCGILAVPGVVEPLKLECVLAAWPQERLLIFCDEDADCADPLTALYAAKRGTPLAVLVGPEGGFDPSERTAILADPSVIRVSLGPRILRADTAAVAILALVQAVLGDWRS